MRFRRYIPGDTKIVREFLFLPVGIGNEWVLFEFIYMKYRYVENATYVMPSVPVPGWDSGELVSKEEYESFRKNRELK